MLNKQGTYQLSYLLSPNSEYSYIAFVCEYFMSLTRSVITGSHGKCWYDVELLCHFTPPPVLSGKGQLPPSCLVSSLRVHSDMPAAAHGAFHLCVPCGSW